MSDLFADAARERMHEVAPLALRLRPRTLEEFVGQQQILAEGSALRLAIAEDRVSSMILFGPPGSGKTTLARIVAETTGAAFEELSAVSASVADVREVLTRARDRLGGSGQRTILFLDEIHRFNKAQQDALLPGVEEGLVTLIGATTENPYF
jgi:putative ATPase